MKCPSMLEVWSACVCLMFVSVVGPAVSAEAPKATDALQLTVDKGQVEFVAVGWPSALRIRGKGNAVVGELAVSGDRLSGRVSFDLDSLVTGIELRDRHMRETYLETAQYPTAVFWPTHLAVERLPATDTFKPQATPFEGQLELHGTKRPVHGTARIARRGSAVDVEATFDLRTTDFDIRTPSYMGITVAQDVKVTVRFSAAVGSNDKVSHR